MGITSNVSKPAAPSMTNVTAPGRGLIWMLDLLAWSAESRTWAETAEIMDNISRPSPAMTNVARPS